MQTPAALGSLKIPIAVATAASAHALFKGADGTTIGTTIGTTLEATLEAVFPKGLLLRLPDGKTLQAQGSLPFPPGSLLSLKVLPLPEGAGLRLQVMRASPPPAPALLSPLLNGEAASLLERAQSAPTHAALGALLRDLLQAGATVAERPGAWSSWMKAAMGTLADPAASPAESVFHRLQGKEGTAWFELPLPWAPGTEPLRIWIETDKDSSRSKAETTHRVFLSVPFSALGEVRLGLEQHGASLRVRLWLQDPRQIAALRPVLEAELASLGRPVDLQILPLPPGAPDLRALAGATVLQAMG